MNIGPTTAKPLSFTNLWHSSPLSEVLDINPLQIGFDYYRECPDANSKTALSWLFDVNEKYQGDIKYLIEQRQQTYEQDGSLKNGMGTLDHCEYLRELKKVVETNVLINRLVTRYPDHANIVKQPHHSTSVYGDIQAALKQKPVPDFNYNQGPEQVG